MWHNASAKSLTTTGFSGISASSELSHFDRLLPQEAECVMVNIPRGERVAGALGLSHAVSSRGSSNGRHKGQSTKQYEILIEPNARTKKAKEALRESAKLDTLLDFDLQRSKAKDPTLDGLLDDRFVFRRERAKHFQTSRHFPALATPRLVPSWQESDATSPTHKQGGGGKDPDVLRLAREGRQRYGRARAHSPTRLSQTTVCSTRRQQSKRPDRSMVPWLANGVADANELICDRRPALFEERYDTAHKAARQDYEESRRRWIGETTVLPATARQAQKLDDSNDLEVQEYVAEMRGRGRENIARMTERYAKTRNKYQDARWKQGDVSNFEKFVRVQEVQRKHEEAAATRQAAKAQQTPVAVDFSGLGGNIRLGLGSTQ